MSLNNSHAFQCNYIPDGYTLKGHVSEQAGLHGALCFVYRPLLATERAIVFDKIKRLPPQAAEEESARVIASRLVEWDLTHPKTGEALPCTKEHVARLQPILGTKLFNVVTGTVPTDIKRDWNGDEETVSDQYELLLSGSNSLEESAAKN